MSRGPGAPTSQLGDSNRVPPLPSLLKCLQGRRVRAEQPAGGAA